MQSLTRITRVQHKWKLSQKEPIHNNPDIAKNRTETDSKKTENLQELEQIRTVPAEQAVNKKQPGPGWRIFIIFCPPTEAFVEAFHFVELAKIFTGRIDGSIAATAMHAETVAATDYSDKCTVYIGLLYGHGATLYIGLVYDHGGG